MTYKLDTFPLINRLSKKKKSAIFYGPLVGKVFRSVARINPKGAPGNGRHTRFVYGGRGLREKGALPEECVHIDASTEPEIPGPTSSHSLRLCRQGSRLAAAGCQAHNLDRVQRRVGPLRRFRSSSKVEVVSLFLNRGVSSLQVAQLDASNSDAAPVPGNRCC